MIRIELRLGQAFIEFAGDFRGRSASAPAHRSMEVRVSVLATMRALARDAFEPTCRRLPKRMVVELLGRYTRGLNVALCLHRVGEKIRDTDPLPNQTIAPSALDELMHLVRAARELGGGPRRLTLAFDDGYRDAVDYVRKRAPDFPDMEWLVFVCPEKLLTRAAFRWDLWENELETRGTKVRLEAMQKGIEPLRENRRPELRALGNRKEYAIASVEECLSLLELKEVTLGNHTNTHLALSTVPDEVARLEVALSTSAFEHMFGPCTQFAFPFGVPSRDYRASDVEALKEIAPRAILWSTEPRPHLPSERRPGAVLPRIPVPGRWSAKAIAARLSILAKRQSSSPAPSPSPGSSPASEASS